MVVGHKVLFMSILLLFCLTLFAQLSGDSMIPLELLRPQYGEDLRFPTDYVIGELGRCDASEESYQLAKRLMVSLISGDGRTGQLAFPEQKRLSALESLGALGVRTWRIGGGRIEPDGSVSYLVRFLGRERSITGELFLRREEAGQAVSAVSIVDSAALTGPETPAAGSEAVPADAIPPPAAVTAAPSEAAVAIWRVDDILLESPRSLSEGKYSPGGADMTPYERFF
jgi:hypothetical protein